MTSANDREEDSFLSRWSRRKRAAVRQEPVPETPDEIAQTAVPATPAEPEPLSEEALAALPRLEDLTETTDISGFLQPGVPTALKNAALRRVWMMSPAIRDYRDPAVDYAWDWNTPGGVPGDGCAPSVEMAQRMLKDLVAPRQDEPAPTAQQVEVAGGAGELERSVDDGPNSPRIEDARQDGDSNPTVSPEAPSGSKTSIAPHNSQDAVKTAEFGSLRREDGLPAQPRRRHGRALPT